MQAGTPLPYPPFDPPNGPDVHVIVRVSCNMACGLTGRLRSLPLSPVTVDTQAHVPVDAADGPVEVGGLHWSQAEGLAPIVVAHGESKWLHVRGSQQVSSWQPCLHASVLLRHNRQPGVCVAQTAHSTSTRLHPPCAMRLQFTEFKMLTAAKVRPANARPANVRPANVRPANVRPG